MRLAIIISTIVMNIAIALRYVQMAVNDVADRNAKKDAEREQRLKKLEAENAQLRADFERVEERLERQRPKEATNRGQEL
jgi:hypothetical protein